MLELRWKIKEVGWWCLSSPDQGKREKGKIRRAGFGVICKQGIKQRIGIRCIRVLPKTIIRTTRSREIVYADMCIRIEGLYFWREILVNDKQLMRSIWWFFEQPHLKVQKSRASDFQRISCLSLLGDSWSTWCYILLLKLLFLCCCCGSCLPSDLHDDDDGPTGLDDVFFFSPSFFSVQFCKIWFWSNRPS